MRQANRFGRNGCYTCVLCGKKTRDAGGNAARQVCSACYDLGDIEVEINDEVITVEEGIRQAAQRVGVPVAQVTWGKHGFQISKEHNIKKRIGAKNLKIGELDEQGGCWFRLRVIVKINDAFSSNWDLHYIDTRAHTEQEALEKIKKLFSKNRWINTQFKFVHVDDRHFQP